MYLHACKLVYDNFIFRSSSVPNVSNKEGKLLIIPNGVTTNFQLMQQQQTNLQQPLSTTTQINLDQINFKVTTKNII